MDSCILVAGVHANHPLHAIASDWLIRNIPLNKLIVAHHSILEAYAVLTRLPGEFRISSSEARKLLETTIQPNMRIAAFSETSIWDYINSLVLQQAIGGHAYDGFIAEILIHSGVEAIATFNVFHFTHLASHVKILDPSKPTPA